MQNKRDKTKRVKYISRVENTKYRNHWWVRIHKQGKLYQIRVFDDECEGTPSDILKYTIYCRDCLHEILFPGYAIADRKPAFTTRNDTGIPGIRYLHRSEDGPRYYIVSWVPTGGAVKQKLFSINSLGEEQALLEAKAFRAEMIDRYYKKSTLPPDNKPNSHK